MSSLVLLMVVTAAIGILARSRLWGRNEPGETTWIDASLKAGVIVVSAVFLVAYLPSRVMQTSAVANLNRPLQDLIGSAVWATGFLAVLTGLAVLHRQRRV